MPIIIKEIHVRTVVERRIVAETEIPEDILRKIENHVAERLSFQKNGQPSNRWHPRRKNER